MVKFYRDFLGKIEALLWSSDHSLWWSLEYWKTWYTDKNQMLEAKWILTEKFLLLKFKRNLSSVNLKENSKIFKGHYVLWEQKSWWSPTWLNIENHDQLAKWHQNLESRIQNQYLDIYFVRPYLDFCFILKMKKIKGLKWSIDNPPTELPRCDYYFGPLHFRTRARPQK